MKSVVQYEKDSWLIWLFISDVIVVLACSLCVHPPQIVSVRSKYYLVVTVSVCAWYVHF